MFCLCGGSSRKAKAENPRDMDKPGKKRRKSDLSDNVIRAKQRKATNLPRRTTIIDENKLKSSNTEPPDRIVVSGVKEYNARLNGTYTRHSELVYDRVAYIHDEYPEVVIRFYEPQTRWVFDWRGIQNDKMGAAYVTSPLKNPLDITRTWKVYDGSQWVKALEIVMEDFDKNAVPQNGNVSKRDPMNVDTSPKTPEADPMSPKTSLNKIKTASDADFELGTAAHRNSIANQKIGAEVPRMEQNGVAPGETKEVANLLWDLLDDEQPGGGKRDPSSPRMGRSMDSLRPKAKLSPDDSDKRGPTSPRGMAQNRIPSSRSEEGFTLFEGDEMNNLLEKKLSEGNDGGAGLPDDSVAALFEEEVQAAPQKKHNASVAGLFDSDPDLTGESGGVSIPEDDGGSAKRDPSVSPRQARTSVAKPKRRVSKRAGEASKEIIQSESLAAIIDQDEPSTTASSPDGGASVATLFADEQESNPSKTIFTR